MWAVVSASAPGSWGDAQLADSLPFLLWVLPVPRAVLRHWASNAEEEVD